MKSSGRLTKTSAGCRALAKLYLRNPAMQAGLAPIGRRPKKLRESGVQIRYFDEEDPPVWCRPTSRWSSYAVRADIQNACC
jgi:hypothetical protein